MRGWPLVELLGLSIALALLVLPLHAFTLGRRPLSAPSPSPVPVVPTADTGERTAARITARFAHPPLRLRVSSESETIWELPSPSAQLVATECELPLGTVGIDLRVEAEWPAGTPETVIELALEPDELETLSRTAWGQGTVDAILTYTWP
jgi:hypothetical protein